MQKLLRVNNIGLKGLNTDIAPWELPPEFLTALRNVRISAGAIEASGGHKSMASVTGFNAGYVVPVGSPVNDYWLACGRSKVYAVEGTGSSAVWHDITSAIGYSSIGTDQELNWSGCMLGAIPVINNPSVSPEYWGTDTAVACQPLMFDSSNTWAASSLSCQVMRSHKNFLFALGMIEGGTDYLDTYRWSHPADPNSLPATWDETDTAFLAGRASLGGDGGAIVDGASLRDSFVIYSENAIDILDYTGDAFVWRRRELSSTIGILSKDCMVEVKGRHFILADGDIISNDGNSISSLVHNKIKRRLTSQMNADVYGRSRVIRNNAYSEVWFCVPEDGAEYPNVAYIYNWQDDSWTIRDLPTGTTSVAYGPKVEPTLIWGGDPLTGNYIEGTWNDNINVWGNRTVTPLNDVPVGIIGTNGSGDSELVFLDPKDNISTYNASIERINYPLETARNVTTITRVYPNIDGNQPVQIQFGSQDYPSGPVRWKQPVTFDPSTDRKIDVRTTGELHCWRISSTGSRNWRISGMDIEYTTSGTR